MPDGADMSPRYLNETSAGNEADALLERIDEPPRAAGGGGLEGEG